jgi:hypothetical protein
VSAYEFINAPEEKKSNRDEKGKRPRRITTRGKKRRRQKRIKERTTNQSLHLGALSAKGKSFTLTGCG